MPECLLPRLAYQRKEGEKPIFIKHNDYEFYSKLNDKSLHYKLLLIPCGSCPHCVQNKSLEWTARLCKEAEEWKYQYFITLTYDDNHLRFVSSDGSIVNRDVNNKLHHSLLKRDVQLFLKRFREKTGFDCKYYICCEAGETTNRTHWHAILYLNEKLSDLVFYSNNLYTSEILSTTWQKGQVLCSSDVNERSIKYTIGYTLKKLGEYKLTLMSKGLGLKYLLHKKEDIMFSKGFYLNDGFLVNPPSYFLRKMKESQDPQDVFWLKEYENTPRSSVKLTKTLEDLLLEFLDLKESTKGKGVF